MFKDKQEELRRLEAELLAEDEQELPDDEFQEDEFGEALEEIFDEDDSGVAEEDPQEEPLVYRNFYNDYGRNRIYNADKVDTDLEEYSEQVRQPKKHSDILVLSAIAMCLVAGIFCVLIWWLLRVL